MTPIYKEIAGIVFDIAEPLNAGWTLAAIESFIESWDEQSHDLINILMNHDFEIISSSVFMDYEDTHEIYDLNQFSCMAWKR